MSALIDDSEPIIRFASEAGKMSVLLVLNAV